MRFLADLKRRRVVSSAIAYLAMAVVVAEGTNIFGPVLGISGSALNWVLYALIAGFPVSLVLAWRYDVTLEGIQRTEPAGRGYGSLTQPGCETAVADDAAVGAGPAPEDGGRRHQELAVPASSLERRQVTVLAARAPGYLEISERLDAEDAQELVDRIGEVAKDVCRRFDGCIHRISGEELVLLFGVPRTHEDDALRGVRAALSMMDGVRRVMASLEEAELPPLREACAVAGGVVLAGPDSKAADRVDASGDALLLAAHLAAHASPGSVLADAVTFRRTEGLLHMEPLPPLMLEGRRDPVEIYRLVSTRAQPTTVHDPGGLQASLVGRGMEMRLLNEALDSLRGGQAQVVTVEGEAGTGKSRLVEEFKRRLDGDVAWLEGHAFPYAEDTPYFPVVDLLSRRFGISDADTPADIRARLRSGLAELGAGGKAVEPWIGSLYELDYPELANVQPDTWQPRLHDAVFRVLSRAALARPTVILLEDLHWADSATVELIHYVAERLRQPALLLLTFRPEFDLKRKHETVPTGMGLRAVHLGELSASESEALVLELLDTDTVPDGLVEFVLSRAAGNPYYIEELVSTLVESGTLLRRGGTWQLVRSLDESSIAPDLQGLVLARLDRLPPPTRRTLQEASVIGRSFQAVVLEEITFDPGGVGARLEEVVKLGLVRVERRSDRTARYEFHHALTQDVVYGSLLRRDRREIHERIAVTLEGLYPERLLEFCETLAFHYKQGLSSLKAVDYLTKAGDKSWRRYALEESDRYFREAFEILTERRSLSTGEKVVLLEVLNRWAIVYNHAGDYRTLGSLLAEHEELARSVASTNPVPAALCFGWLGYALQCRERLEESYAYLNEALEMTRRATDPTATAYASAWMARTCVDMGRLDEAVEHGLRARETAARLEPDAKLFRFTYSALGLAYYFRGEREPLDSIADELFEYGEEHTDLRAMLLAYVNRGCSFLIAGEFDEAIEAYQRGIKVSVDPMYSMYARLMLGVTYASAGHLEQAEETLTEVVEFDRSHGFDMLGTTARGMMSIVLLSRGQLAEGVRVAEEVLDSYEERGNRYRHALQEYMLGGVYLRLALREGSGGLGFMARNAGFLLRNVPQARAKARAHLSAAVRIAREINAKGVLGQALMDLARLLDASGEPERAEATLRESVEVLERCGATAYLLEARALFDDVGVAT